MLTKNSYKKMAASRINEAMERKGVTKRELAKAVNVSAKAIYSYTSGARMAPIEVLVNICMVLNAEIRDITFFGPYVDLSIKQEDNYEEYLQRLIFND